MLIVSKSNIEQYNFRNSCLEANMELSLGIIEKLISAVPGNSVVFSVKDGESKQLGYTESVAPLYGLTVEEYNNLSDQARNQLIQREDQIQLMKLILESIHSHSEIEYIYCARMKSGSLTHIRVNAKIVGSYQGGVVFLAVLTPESLDRLQMNLINEVPVGMGVYEIVNGVPNVRYLNDSYFEMMGFTREERAQYSGMDTVKAIYKEDRHIIMEGIQNVIQKQLNTYRVVVRMSLTDPTKFHWVQMECTVANRKGSTLTMYVSFTKIDDLQKTKEELEKSHAFMASAIDSANISFFEYLPDEHIARRRNPADKFNLPPTIKNYPVALYEKKIYHPDDVENIKKAFMEIDQGSFSATWTGRILTRGKYRWYTCSMKASDDVTMERVVSCTLCDITVQKEAEREYAYHLTSILRANPDAVSTFRMNLTTNRCEDGYSSYENIHNLNQSGTYDGFVEKALPFIATEEERIHFKKLFDRKTLIQNFIAGNNEVSVEHRYIIKPGDTEWIRTKLDLMRNPETNDIEGIMYTVNTNRNRVEEIILRYVVQQSYDAIAVVYLDTDEAFIYEECSKSQGVHVNDFSKKHDSFMLKYASEDQRELLQKQLSYERIRRELETKNRYSFSFFSNDGTGLKRKRASYQLVDPNKKTLLASMRDYSDEDLIERFRYASEHDAVTGLYNRQNTLEKTRKMLQEHPNENFYMCHMDIQRFHLINSFYGDEEGNRLLRGLGKRLEKASKQFPYSVYGRIEGDVFLACVPENRELLEEQVKEIKEWLDDYPLDFKVEGNFGSYLITDHSISIEAMFERATLAGKYSRNSRIYHYSYFDEAMEQELRNEQQINTDMHAAIDQEQFEVYIQPKYILKNSTPYGGEALVRWKHPTRGMISPGEFIPLFEKNGFIIQLDQYMWEHVCRLLRKWLDVGKNPAPISVNVSRVSMYSPYTVPFICELVDSYHIPHHLFQLELTESAYMDDPDEMKRRLSVLQEKGFEILMDDFGSGYSSLNTLRELPVNYLKIDMNFLSAKEDGKRSRLILASVVRMACWLNLPVITEGVETPEQKEFLNGIGCDYAQGYFFAKPMPVDQYEKLMSGSEGYQEETAETNLSTIANLMVNTSEVGQYLAENLPLPIALADVTENDFSYIRSNTYFRDAFGFETDIIEKEQLLLNHVSENEYDVLMRTYQKTIHTKGKEECIFYWKGKDEGIHCYLVRTQYLTHTTYSSILLVIFMDVTPYQRIRNLQPGNVRKEYTHYDCEKLNETLVMMGNVFDSVRLIRPETDRVMDFDMNCNIFTQEEKCFRCWKRSVECEPCIGKQAIEKRQTMMHLETQDDDPYFLYATPIVLTLDNGESYDCVIETTTKLNEQVKEQMKKISSESNNEVEIYRELSYKDSLTVAWNRRYYNEMKYLENAQTNHVGFILLDLYGLKYVNSTYGHMVGDAILIESAIEIQRNIRPNDSLIRYEGDEYLIVMVDCNEEELKTCAERLQTALRQIQFGVETNQKLHVATGYTYESEFTKHIDLSTHMIDKAVVYLRKDKERIKEILKNMDDNQ